MKGKDMKSMVILSTIIMIVLFCPPVFATEKTDMEILVQENTTFAMILYQNLCKEGGNVFFSPYSISTALAMTYAGARGNTETEMATTLRFSLGQEKLHPAFAQVESRLNDVQKSGDVKLGVANSLWPHITYNFLDDYMALILKNYGVSITPVNYELASEREVARKTINGWVENKTQNKIPNLIQPGALTSLTRLVLVNAIYFKGNWASQFKPENTKDAPFHLSPEKSIQVAMMNQTEKFRHADLDFFDMLELPYVGNDLSMLILLPKTHDHLVQLETSLSLENLQLWKGKLEMKKVAISLPKFKTTCGYSLGGTLVPMGMADAFDYRTANFSGMDSANGLYISAVIHKAFVDVNEEGTEATAATAVIMSLRGIPLPPTIFRVDRPFVFLIQDNQTGTILFMGRVANPTKMEE